VHHERRDVYLLDVCSKVREPRVDAGIARVPGGGCGDLETGAQRRVADSLGRKFVGVVEVGEEVVEPLVAVGQHRLLDAVENGFVDTLRVVVGLQQKRWDRSEQDRLADPSGAVLSNVKVTAVNEATGVSRDFYGTQWWRDPTGWTMAELAGPLGGGKGAMYREYWSRWLDKVRARHAHWTQMSTLPAQSFITMPSPVRGTHYGLGFAAGGRLRSDFYVDLGSPEASAAQFDVIQSQQDMIEMIYGAPLSWERLPDRAAFRIADYSEGEITRVEDYAFYIDWMIDAQERLRRAINSVLQTGEPPDDDFDRR